MIRTSLTRLPRTAAVVGVLVLVGSSRARVSDVDVERTTWLMGTRLTISAAASDEKEGFQAIGDAFDSVRVYEALLSTWREESHLSRVNRAAVGLWVELPSRLAELLSVTRSWREATGGAFDPAIGALIDAWDLRGRGRVPDDTLLARARAASGLARFEFSDNGTAVRRRTAGAWLDSGAFGKGAALRAAAEALRARGLSSAVVNFGGQVLVLDPAPGRVVTVADPRARDRVATCIQVSAGSAATSSQSERFVVVGGERLGHVLDPRTGRPIEPWGSVTVVHQDPLVADILSTALFVMGPRAGLQWAEVHGVAALFLVIRPDAAPSGQLDARCTGALRTHFEEQPTCRCDSRC